jgi:hypothetical protein
MSDNATAVEATVAAAPAHRPAAPLLRLDAALASGEYICLLDDIHWIAPGTEIAAAAIAERLYCPDDVLEP